VHVSAQDCDRCRAQGAPSFLFLSLPCMEVAKETLKAGERDGSKVTEGLVDLRGGGSIRVPDITHVNQSVQCVHYINHRPRLLPHRLGQSILLLFSSRLLPRAVLRKSLELVYVLVKNLENPFGENIHVNIGRGEDKLKEVGVHFPGVQLVLQGDAKRRGAKLVATDELLVEGKEKLVGLALVLDNVARGPLRCCKVLLSDLPVLVNIKGLLVVRAHRATA